jgi:hypothetical protein
MRDPATSYHFDETETRFRWTRLRIREQNLRDLVEIKITLDLAAAVSCQSRARLARARGLCCADLDAVGIGICFSVMLHKKLHCFHHDALLAHAIEPPHLRIHFRSRPLSRLP